MNNLYTYSDEELNMATRFLAEELIAVANEIRRRAHARKDIEGRMDRAFGSGPGDAA